jgi:cold shock protein
MATGKVKFFNETKGFGFIVEDDTNNEYFVHISGAERELTEGEEVEFDLEEGRKGMNAVNVKVINS